VVYNCFSERNFCFFAVVLIFKREAIYGPMDFRSDESFLRLFDLNNNRLAALLIDPRDDENIHKPIVNKMLNSRDYQGILHIATGYFKVKNYRRCIEILELLKLSDVEDEFVRSKLQKIKIISHTLVGKYDEISNLDWEREESISLKLAY